MKDVSKMTLLVFFITIVVVHCVLAVNISPKLDFEEAPVTSHAAIKINQGGNLRPRFESPEKFQDIQCASNDCIVSKSSDSASATADVVVHVKTQVNVPIIQNETRSDNVPDVPIIVGTKDLSSNVPIHPDSAFRPSFYPNYDTPSVGFNVVNKNPLNVGRAFNNYAPNNGIPFNNYNNRYMPELYWYPQQKQDNVYNPVEFTKVYKNAWTSDFPSDWSGYLNKRHTHSNSEWVPCFCDNPQAVSSNSDLSKWNELLGIKKHVYLN